MYEVKKVTREVKGLVDLTVKNTKDNAVELAAAWGLFAHRGLREGYTIKGDSVTFRMTNKTFAERLENSQWCEILFYVEWQGIQEHNEKSR